MRNLLYIDDNDADHFIVAESFQNTEYNLVCVNSADRGFRELLNGDYDLVICDLMMPGSDGLEFAKRMSASGIDIPLILTSGISALQSFENYKGLVNYIGFALKPITLDKIKVLMMKGDSQ